LTIDGDLSAQEVDPIQREPEALALAKPGAGGEDYERPIAVRDSIDDRLNDLGLQRLDPSRFGPR
jgi:hypothetical protein